MLQFKKKSKILASSPAAILVWGKGLALHRQNTLTGTHDDSVHWRIYAS